MIFSLWQSADQNGSDRARRVVLQPNGIASTVARILGEWETLVFGFPALGVESVKGDGVNFRSAEYMEATLTVDPSRSSTFRFVSRRLLYR